MDTSSTFHNVFERIDEQQPWQEPAIAFERLLTAEAQGGPGPHGAPSGLLGPLASSGSTISNICTVT